MIQIVNINHPNSEFIREFFLHQSIENTLRTINDSMDPTFQLPTIKRTENQISWMYYYSLKDMEDNQLYYFERPGFQYFLIEENNEYAEQEISKYTIDNSILTRIGVTTQKIGFVKGLHVMVRVNESDIRLFLESYIVFSLTYHWGKISIARSDIASCYERYNPIKLKHIYKKWDTEDYDKDFDLFFKDLKLPNANTLLVCVQDKHNMDRIADITESVQKTIGYNDDLIWVYYKMPNRNEIHLIVIDED